MSEATVIIQIVNRERSADGKYWIDAFRDGQLHESVGPFDTEEERERAHDDMVSMLDLFGGKPVQIQ